MNKAEITLGVLSGFTGGVRKASLEERTVAEKTSSLKLDELSWIGSDALLCVADSLAVILHVTHRTKLLSLLKACVGMMRLISAPTLGPQISRLAIPITRLRKNQKASVRLMSHVETVNRLGSYSNDVARSNTNGSA